MYQKLLLPNGKTVDIGLDWVAVDSYVESPERERHRLARVAKAAWFYKLNSVRGDKSSPYCYAFVTQDESKTRPVAGAEILRYAALDCNTFISLLKLKEDEYWFVGFANGLPITGNERKSSEFIGDKYSVKSRVNEFLAGLETGTVPVYTDSWEIFENITAYDLEERRFDFDILAEYFTRTNVRKSKFQRYTRIPVGKSLLLLSILGLLGYLALDHWSSNTQDLQRQKAERLKRENERKARLANSIASAINKNLPANVVVPAYMSALSSVPTFINGWQLTDVVCSDKSCELNYKGGKFATWDGYLVGRPSNWERPNIGRNTQQVTQHIDVILPSIPKRTAQSLAKSDELMFYLGNLSQVADTINVSFAIRSMPSAVVQEQAEWVPFKGTYDANGSAEFIEGLARRLPSSVGASEVSFVMGNVINFNMRGEFYAVK